MKRFAIATTSIPALIARPIVVAVYDTITSVSMKKKKFPANLWKPAMKKEIIHSLFKYLKKKSGYFPVEHFNKASCQN